MVPLKLSLKNFLSYSEDAPALDFSGFSVACLSGKNGHGKSALLDAITWALWGQCRVKSKSKEEIIKRGAKEAAVELEFEVEGNRYRVLRTITRKKIGAPASVEFQVFDTETSSYKPLDKGAKTQDTIEKILKMDYDSFICSSFVLQGRADEFTKRTPAERKEVLAGILDLEKYEKMGRRAKELALKAKQETESADRELNRMESEILQKAILENESNEAEEQERNTARELGKTEKSYEGIIREAEALRSKIENHDNLIREAGEAREKQTRLERQLNNLIGEINKDREIVFNEREILEGYGKFQLAKEDEVILSEKLIKYTGLLKQLETINRLVSDERSKLERKLSSLNGKKEEVEKRLAGIEKLLNREDEIRAGLEEFSAFQSLERDMEEKRRESEKLRFKRMEIENDIRNIRLGIESRIRELDVKAKDFSGKAERAEKLSEECEKLKSEIRAAEDTQSECETLRAKLKETGEEKKVSVSRKSEFEKRRKEEKGKLVLIESESENSHCPLCESVLMKEARELLVRKLENLLVDIERRLEEESAKIGRLEREEKAVASGIRAGESETKKLPELNKQLGEKEKSLKDSLAARKDLELIEKELEKAGDMIEKENFGFELRRELEDAAGAMAKLSYSEEEHKRVTDKLETLRNFQSEYKQLEDAKLTGDETRRQLSNIESESLSLVQTLNEGAFAVQYKKQADEAMQKVEETGYNEERHKELKASLKNLEKFDKEKEDLDRVKLNLSHKEKERQSLEEQTHAERDRLGKIEREIRALEEFVSRNQGLKDEEKILENKVLELRAARSETLNKKSKIKFELDRIIKLESRREEILKQAGEIKHDLTVYQELDKAFGKNGIQALIIESAVPEIEAEGNRILRRLTDGGMTLSLDMLRPTQKGGEKETLEIKIGDSSGTRSYETYSGGEAFRIDFALRVAISKFIANRTGAQLRTLVIDEGFGTQDKDGISQFIHVINTIKDDFEKILVITHVDELKDKFPVRIEVIKETGKGSSFEMIYS